MLKPPVVSSSGKTIAGKTQRFSSLSGLTALCLAALFSSPSAQTPNYEETTVYNVDEPGNSVTSRSYSDGLGRPLQSQTLDNVTNQVMVSGNEYDAAGRLSKSTKPFRKMYGVSLDYISDVVNQANSNPLYLGDTAYSLKRYYDDPLSRDSAIGAPGKNFTVSSNHSSRVWYFGVKGDATTVGGVAYFDVSGFITSTYLTDAALSTTIPTALAPVVTNGTYIPKYFLTVTRDPNGVYSQTLTDLFGKTVRTWATSSGTNSIMSSYSYDVLGQTLVETPPPVSGKAVNPTKYYYNTSGQLDSSRTPDGGKTAYVYDNAGRVVQSIDSNGYSTGTVKNFTYDQLGRQTKTTLWKNQALNNSTRIRNVYDDTTTLHTLIQNTDLANNSWLLDYVYNERGRLVATISYDDKYTGDSTVAMESAYANKVVDLFSYDNEGRVSMKITAVPGMPCQRTYFYYDDQGKLIEKDCEDSYNFFTYNYKYDKNGRMSEISVDGVPFIVYTYDDLGRVSQKTFKNSFGGSYPVDYTYNIRDWTKTIRANGATHFTDTLCYDDASANQQYNGNIAIIKQNFPSLGAPYGSGMGFWLKNTYDQANRLTKVENILSATSTYKDFYSTCTYLEDGRINIKQEGIAQQQWGAYSYYPNSNKLQGVSSPTRSGTNYIYDPNGNMVFDRSKKMVIVYDWRNMPTRFYIYNNIPSTVTNVSTLNSFVAAPPSGYARTNEIVMLYNAAGDRIKKEEFTPNTTTRLNGVAYSHGSIYTTGGKNDYILSYADVAGEGHVLPNGDFEFYVKDHLGSTRLVITEKLAINEGYDYLPYGTQMRRTADIPLIQKTREKFTGKEWDVEGGVNLTYFGKRYYDPEIGLWTSTDPKEQFWSPYAYAGNGINCINSADKNGGYLNIIIQITSQEGPALLESPVMVPIIRNLDKITRFAQGIGDPTNPAWFEFPAKGASLEEWAGWTVANGEDAFNFSVDAVDKSYWQLVQARNEAVDMYMKVNNGFNNLLITAGTSIINGITAGISAIQAAQAAAQAAAAAAAAAQAASAAACVGVETAEGIMWLDNIIPAVIP